MMGFVLPWENRPCIAARTMTKVDTKRVPAFQIVASLQHLSKRFVLKDVM